jgi:hypothetical protein
LKTKKKVFFLNRYLKYIRKWNVLDALQIGKPEKCYMTALLYWNKGDVSISFADEVFHSKDALNHATCFVRYLLNLEHPPGSEEAQVS